MKITKRKLLIRLGVPLVVVIAGLIGTTALGFYTIAHPKVPLSVMDTSTQSTPIHTAAPITVPPLNTAYKPYTYTVPAAPTAKEDPTVAWNDNYSYMFNQLATYAQQVSSAIGTCGTANPDYNSMCVDYDGSSVLPICTSLLDNISTAEKLPGIPNASANTSWQAALSSFQDGAQICVAKINAHQYVGTSTDVGFTVKPDMYTGVQNLISTENAITSYLSTL